MAYTLLKQFAQAINTQPLPHVTNTGTTKISSILSIVFATLGAISVIMVIIGGIKYAGSQGDPAGTAKAKNTIIYAIVGVLVAIFAVTIVQFAVGKLFQ